MGQRVVQWLSGLLPAVSVAVFAGTLLPYLNSKGTPLGWSPLVVGVLVFACLVGYCMYLVRGTARSWQVAVTVVVSVGVFMYAFFFVVLNTVGA